jgi:hypothetical protein
MRQFALARIRAAIASREDVKPLEPLPPKVQAFWDYLEAEVPAWRLESQAGRESQLPTGIAW